MSVLHCDVLLDNQKPIYEPGDKLTGRVILTLDVRLLLKAVFLEYTGYADVQLQTPKKVKKTKKKRNQQENGASLALPGQKLEVYTNREDFLSTVNYFVGSEEATPRIVERGTYVYPFSVTLPASCPTSFESPNGRVRYMIEVYIVHKNKRELHYTQKLNVQKPFHLRQATQLAPQPCEVRVQESVFLKIFKEPMQMLVTLQQNRLVPGDMLSAHISIHNPRRLKLHELTYELLRILRITASHGHKKTKTKYFHTILAKSVHNFGGDRELMAQHLQNLLIVQTVPTTDPADCRCLQISYELQVRLYIVPGRLWLQAKVPIIVGTVPLLQLASVREVAREVQWDQKLSLRSMDDLSARRAQLEADEYHSVEATRNRQIAILSASAPPPEIRERSASMTSLSSSSFREAEYMLKTKFDEEPTTSKHKTEETAFRPRYLYYDMKNTPREDIENTDVISSPEPESEQDTKSTLTNSAYAGVLQQLVNQLQERTAENNSDR